MNDARMRWRKWEAKAVRFLVLGFLIPVPVAAAFLVWSFYLNGGAQTITRWTGLACLAIGSMVIYNYVFRESEQGEKTTRLPPES